MARAGVDKKTSDIILRTKEFYYGLLLAKDMRNLVLEIRDELVDYGFLIPHSLCCGVSSYPTLERGGG